MRIALDAMGTDQHPGVEVAGAVQALRELSGNFEVVLVGDRQRIEEELSQAGEFDRRRIVVVHASQIIEPSEPPVTAVRKKPDSSIGVGLKLHKEQEVDAFISAGSTGAVMAASLFLLGRLPGVDRPSVATILPTAGAPILLADAGANVDCKPVHLVQFARLAAVYAEDVLGRPRPRVGLLNIGEEAEKGNEVALETHRRLRESDLNFIGNVEGRDIIHGVCDVLIADGFVGNVLLKFYESIASHMYKLVAKELKPAPAELKRVFHSFDWTEYGGAPLLGVNGVSIICHGGSPPNAIRNAIRVAVQAVETRVVGHISREIRDHERADHAGDERHVPVREKAPSAAGTFPESE